MDHSAMDHSVHDHGAMAHDHSAMDSSSTELPSMVHTADHHMVRTGGDEMAGNHHMSHMMSMAVSRNKI